jgi:small-conductance mechanosensitive channel
VLPKTLPEPSAEPSSDTSPEKSADPLTVAAIRERHNELRSALSEFERWRENDDTISAAVETEIRESFDAIEGALLGQLELATRLAVPRERAGPSGSEPPSIFGLGALYEREAARAEEEGRLRASLAEARDALQAAREAATEADRVRRRLIDSGNAAEDSVEFRRLALASRVAAEEVHLRRLGVRVDQSDLKSLEEGEGGQAEIDAVRGSIAAGRSNSEEGYKSLLVLEAGLRRQKETYERLRATVELRIKSIENRYAAARAGDADLLAQVESLSAQRDLVTHEISLMEARILRAARRTELWRTWEDALVRPGAEQQRQSTIARIEESVASLAQSRQRLEIRIAAQDRISRGLDARLERLGAETPLRSAVLEQRDALIRLRREEAVAVEEIASDQRLCEYVLAELENRLFVDPREALRRVRHIVLTLWDFELASVQDAPITIGSVVVALLVMGVGTWISRRLSGLAGAFAERRFNLAAGAATSLQTIFFYVLLVSFALLALRAVHFPLTAFTVAGGALAIGVGFGSQNVMNNFISGLILMLERPVRPHDMVEVDGNHGTIERIGARSTQIRSADGRHIVVPNSFFLESNVVNWTLSDDLIRTSVVVGVIYGSPTRVVEDLIRQVAAEIEEVLAEPEPIILFADFGDNALTFEVHFWLRARGPMQKKKVESRVRFRIDDLFREHSLVIAFPQRDVHLDTVKPLEVRVVGSQDPS